MNNLLQQYKIVEIFSSYQGEGSNLGMPTTFIRFGGCNLSCPWCDTDYTNYKLYSLADIILLVNEFGNTNIILTGGEPSIQKNLSILVDALRENGCTYIAVETNGLKDFKVELDFIATSPKRIYFAKYKTKLIKQADEVRIVCDGNLDEMLEFCLFIEKKLPATYYFISPCEIDGEMNILSSMQVLYHLNKVANKHWQFNIQTHKLIGLR